MRQEQKEKITNHIIEALEQGNIPWVSPFERQIFPTNFFTGIMQLKPLKPCYYCTIVINDLTTFAEVKKQV